MARPPGAAPAPSVATVLGIAAAAGLVPLNSTMIAVALPTIAEQFDISTGTASILITVYLFAMLIGQPIAGRISDSLGNRRTVAFALVGLIATSLAGALVPTFALLVVARTLQACCAAALGPSVQALLRAITPPDEQGRTFGLMGSVLGTGAALGPVIGGVLTQAIGWEAIFYVNIPIAAGALAIAVRIRVPDARDDGADGRVRSTDTRVVDGRILNRVFVACFSVQALSTVAQYALLLLTPIILDARGWPSGSIGLCLSALTIGMIVMGPPGGRAGDTHGRRLPTLIGLTVGSLAVGALFVGGPSVAAALLVVALAVFGLGLGAATPNLMSSALESVPMSRTGGAAGVLSMSRYVGSITTSLTISAVVTADAGGTRIVLAMSCLAMVAAVLVTSQLPSVIARPRRVVEVAAD
ncbi:MFS transporter [Ilumatobacter nonamiensis]|uniref:MFS transporter n=1 Tax=Ilumatobacter nonamiensis TaxID=467093 RepID=UPI0003472791|nr:MFS transporter [Ilumatobacter nonamiensis]